MPGLAVQAQQPGAASPEAPAQASPLLQSLEAALNAPGDGALEALLQPAPGFDPGAITARRQALRSRFPDARWSVTPGPTLANGRATVNLRVTGSRNQAPFAFSLEADQQLALAWSGGRISGEEILREQSVVSTTNGDLAVRLQVPDAVLTGQRYDLDVVFDDPLDGAVVAGAIQPVSAAQLLRLQTPDLPLEALGGGGLFKTVQAPYQPGSQTWAVLLVHPKGVVAASKQVRVVADRQSLQP